MNSIEDYGEYKEDWEEAEDYQEFEYNDDCAQDLCELFERNQDYA
jgi:hypothetical protein